MVEFTMHNDANDEKGFVTRGKKKVVVVEVVEVALSLSWATETFLEAVTMTTLRRFNFDITAGTQVETSIVT